MHEVELAWSPGKIIIAGHAFWPTGLTAIVIGSIRSGVTMGMVLVLD
jgi:hypothetical protein